MTASCVSRRANASPLSQLTIGFLLIASLFALNRPANAAEAIAVHIDQATVIKMPERSSTVVVGNPLIADLTIEPGNIAVVTGKGYGATNIIVMDRTGTVLMEKMVEVLEAGDKTVFVWRGASRETYSCAPGCERRITLGDFPEYFDKTLA